MYILNGKLHKTRPNRGCSSWSSWRSCMSHRQCFSSSTRPTWCPCSHHPSLPAIVQQSNETLRGCSASSPQPRNIFDSKLSPSDQLHSSRAKQRARRSSPTHLILNTSSLNCSPQKGLRSIKDRHKNSWTILYQFWPHPCCYMISCHFASSFNLCAVTLNITLYYTNWHKLMCIYICIYTHK